MQKFIEVLYKLVLLKAADEHVYDSDEKQSPHMETHYYPPHFYHVPSYTTFKHNKLDKDRNEVKESEVQRFQQVCDNWETSINYLITFKIFLERT